MYEPSCAHPFLRSISTALAVAVLSQGLSPLPTHAQVVVPPQGEMEQYLRLLQVTGRAPLHPWSVRGFGPREIQTLLPRGDDDPWSHLIPRASHASATGLRARLLPTSVRGIFNSHYPLDRNDGVTWAGKGVTGEVRFGGAMEWGPLTVVAEPVAFWSQNRDFQLAPTLREGRERFAEYRFVNTGIDHPQRYGPGSYARLDAGNSQIRLDFLYVALGFSTGHQVWGPGQEQPVILGTNAPGFPHIFLGTSEPVNIWLGTVSGRVSWGRLSQTGWALLPDPPAHRLMSGVVGTFSPRWIPNLEVGAGRFFHEAWPDDGLRLEDFRRPIEPFLKETLRERFPDTTGENPLDRVGLRPENQLASFFARWVFPASGFEAYLEWGKEDHSFDLRDLFLRPDNQSGYLIGFRKVWEGRAETPRWSQLRGELLNLKIGPLRQVQGYAPFYVHMFSDEQGRTRQGHTHRGRILGAPAGYGGAGSHLAWDRYEPWGRWTLKAARELRTDRPLSVSVWEGRPMPTAADVGPDVLYALGGEAVLFRGRYTFHGGLTGAYNFNRYYLSNEPNLRLDFGVKAAF